MNTNHKIYHERLILLSITVIVLSVFTAVKLLGGNLDTRELAKGIETSKITPGCYYRLNCPAKELGRKSQFDCQPTLICPTPVSTRLSCRDCLNNKNKMLCFDTSAKASYCTDATIAGTDVVRDGLSCVSCAQDFITTPTVTKPTPSCTPRPRCLDYPPFCQIAMPEGGYNWCKPTTISITGKPPTPFPTKVISQSGTPLAMSYFNPSPKGHMCDYPVTAVLGRHLKNNSGEFDPSVLAEAEACGRKVLLFLSDKTENVVGDTGGLDLTKYRNEISFFDGKIDKYVESGVIMAHMVVDEPHDCNNDWKGSCPSASTVDQVSKISKELWPTLQTFVNTVPSYIQREGYTWQNTDIMNFQYAYHKGDLNKFVSDAVSHLNSGKFRDIAWALQVKSGGCARYQECSMTPEQVQTVTSTMCNGQPGKWLAFVWYDPAIMTPEMLTAATSIQSTCQ